MTTQNHINHLVNTMLVFLVLLISACSNNYGRYQQKHDSIPQRLPTQSELIDATPRAEGHSRGGNKDYQVRGEYYQVLASAKNFKETGTASWYGEKFHGHLTSNGEVYDMYAMSAAHKNLPLPTYVKVLNNDNGLSVIVRVNDRGPFHDNRIIDLSYSAAYKLDMLKKGTANVTISAITEFSNHHVEPPKLAPSKMALSENDISDNISTNSRTAPAIKQPKSTPHAAEKPSYIQVFASNSNSQARKLANHLSITHQQSTQLEKINGIFRVLVGPIAQHDDIKKLLLSIKSSGYPEAFIRSID